MASRQAISLATHGHGYTAVETSKAGRRYYRLRQLDLDGRQPFAPVTVVYFGAAAELAAAAWMPNPIPSRTRSVLRARAP